MLAEAADAARQVGIDANLRGTAFGSVNIAMHHVNVAVSLGDAGTAIDLTRQIDLAAIDVAQAFHSGRYEQAFTTLHAAEQTAPEETTARASARTLAVLPANESRHGPSASRPGQPQILISACSEKPIRLASRLAPTRRFKTAIIL